MSEDSTRAPKVAPTHAQPCINGMFVFLFFFATPPPGLTHVRVGAATARGVYRSFQLRAS